MNVLHIERLLYYQKHSLFGLELFERSHWRGTAPDKHWSFSDKKLSAYTASLYTRNDVYIYVWMHMTTKLMYLMIAYYTPNDGFTANDVSFYKSKVG